MMGGAGGTGNGSGGNGSGGNGSGGQGTGGNGGSSDAAADGTTNDAGADQSTEVGGDSGPPVYSPCPTDGTPCKILPLGDSITWGSSSPAGDVPGGYRVQLFHDALSDKKNITFVGADGKTNGPATVDGVHFPPDNAGYPGWNLDQISGLIPTPALQKSPHIILLMAGTNDRYGAANVAAQKLGTLLDKIIAAAPQAILVVAQVIPITDNDRDKAFAPAYNALIPAVVEQRAKDGKHIILVDQFTTFNVSTMMSPDNIHPNQTGYNHMGDLWYAAVKSALN